jgi:hypothetical protein
MLKLRTILPIHSRPQTTMAAALSNLPGSDPDTSITISSRVDTKCQAITTKCGLLHRSMLPQTPRSAIIGCNLVDVRPLIFKTSPVAGRPCHL